MKSFAVGVFQFLSILAIIFIFCWTGCRKDLDFNTDPSAKLSFSVDTLFFDTVFTTQGSATRIIKIFNHDNKPVKISKVYLEKGSGSMFNLNVDGTPGKSVSNVEIEANDSIYVFAEVTINPNDPLTISPFVLDENLIFELNGNQQKVVLEAWGQNANYIPNNHNSNGVAITTCQLGNISWNDPKPYVIYGVLLIDSCTLNIPAGTKIYVHGGVAKNVNGTYSDGFIYTLTFGKLNITGTKDNPVVIQGDRLEAEFKDVPAQWAGIRIGPSSKGNIIRYAVIKNSIVGVRADSNSQVKIYNTRIYNTSSSGLLGVHATMVAENCLMYNNGGNAFQAEFGGNYFLSYCTLASYNNDQSALSLNNVKCLDVLCADKLLYGLSADIKNCIITGSQNDEIDLLNGSNNPSDFTLNLKNNVVRVKDLLKANQFPNFLTDICINCINTKPIDHLFKDVNKDNYKLDTLSVAEQKAIPVPTILKDIDDRDRDAVMPDIGSYEYYVE